MKHLLVVDDDPALPVQFRSMLGEGLGEWIVHGATTADTAIKTMCAASIDIVFVGTHLGGIGGIELLTDIKHRFPLTIRIAMSGAAHQTMVMRFLEVAHQFIPKPVIPEAFRSALARATCLPQMSTESIRGLVADLRSVPCLPDIYQELVAELQSPRASIEAAARILSRDMAMVSKIMQVVNSAYFSLRRTISSPAHAMALLGIDTVKSLVLGLQIFSQFPQTASLPLSVDTLWRHAMSCAVSARAIAQAAGLGTLAVEAAFVAGLVHDLGLLILATNYPDRYAAVLRGCGQNMHARVAAETEVFGASHCEIAGYLLGIWGLQDSIVEAASYHHKPSCRPHRAMSVLTAVHVADALDDEGLTLGEPCNPESIDMAYLSACGVVQHLSRWRETCRQAA
ncbi:two-component system response regulator [Nitrospira sp. KM1]|uniref:HDOD domain-containing protein n=1 Tax=Nitrospira sp. KM1 TaxID=1936990 RepID=UPI0013A74B94|nr:HDOD domain-containing protein [Nitrospira sp. KM1]BCA54747.1 two-component system response regulator [Nitrospira sp. KM1]